MQTIKKIYRIKRDISNNSKIISTEPANKIEDIPVEKILSAILHKIITKENGTKNYECKE